MRNRQRQNNAVGSTLLYAVGAFVILMLGSLLKRYSSLSDRDANILLGIVLIVYTTGAFLIALIKAIKQQRAHNRSKNIIQFAEQRGMKPSSINGLFSAALEGISEDKDRYKNIHLENIFTDGDWIYGEYVFEEYGKSKHGPYRVATYRFSFAVFELPRILPNIFFDSGRTGGNEFKLLFRQNQKHSMESVFDQHFATYFHEDYRIDSLSIISPEVMESLIMADDYDIEIYKNKLILMSEIRDLPQQFDDMKSKGIRIKNKLLNNISTYRDERINFEEGRRTISATGLRLKKSLTKYYAGMTIGVLMCLFVFVYILYYYIISKSPQTGDMTYIFIIGLFLIVRNARRIQQIKKEDKELN